MSDTNPFQSILPLETFGEILSHLTSTGCRDGAAIESLTGPQQRTMYVSRGALAAFAQTCKWNRSMTLSVLNATHSKDIRVRKFDEIEQEGERVYRSRNLASIREYEMKKDFLRRDESFHIYRFWFAVACSLESVHFLKYVLGLEETQYIFTRNREEGLSIFFKIMGQLNVVKEAKVFLDTLVQTLDIEPLNPHKLEVHLIENTYITELVRFGHVDTLISWIEERASPSLPLNIRARNYLHDVLLITNRNDWGDFRFVMDIWIRLLLSDNVLLVQQWIKYLDFTSFMWCQMRKAFTEGRCFISETKNFLNHWGSSISLIRSKEMLNLVFTSIAPVGSRNDVLYLVCCFHALQRDLYRRLDPSSRGVPGIKRDQEIQNLVVQEALKRMDESRQDECHLFADGDWPTRVTFHGLLCAIRNGLITNQVRAIVDPGLVYRFVIGINNPPGGTDDRTAQSKEETNEMIHGMGLKIEVRLLAYFVKYVEGDRTNERFSGLDLVIVDNFLKDRTGGKFTPYELQIFESMLKIRHLQEDCRERLRDITRGYENTKRVEDYLDDAMGLVWGKG